MALNTGTPCKSIPMEFAIGSNTTVSLKNCIMIDLHSLNLNVRSLLRIWRSNFYVLIFCGPDRKLNVSGIAYYKNVQISHRRHKCYVFSHSDITVLLLRIHFHRNVIPHKRSPCKLRIVPSFRHYLSLSIGSPILHGQLHNGINNVSFVIPQCLHCFCSRHWRLFHHHLDIILIQSRCVHIVIILLIFLNRWNLCALQTNA